MQGHEDPGKKQRLGAGIFQRLGPVLQTRACIGRAGIGWWAVWGSRASLRSGCFHERVEIAWVHESQWPEATRAQGSPSLLKWEPWRGATNEVGGFPDTALNVVALSACGPPSPSQPRMGSPPTPASTSGNFEESDSQAEACLWTHVHGCKVIPRVWWFCFCKVIDVQPVEKASNTESLRT